MTVLVAARCTDGIVVGADSLSTSAAGAQSLMQLRSDDKITIIDGKIIVAGTGSVGLSQRFNDVVTRLHAQGLFTQPCLQCCRLLSAAAIQDFSNTGIQRQQFSGFGLGALIAAPIENVSELVEFGLLDFQPERKTSRSHFLSMGSGQILADPFLAFISRVLWGQNEPNVQLAKLGVFWALSHAIEYAPGGVGRPIQMATLQSTSADWRATLLQEDELGELEQHIHEIEGRIARYPDEVIAQAAIVPLPAAP